MKALLFSAVILASLCSTQLRAQSNAPAAAPTPPASNPLAAALTTDERSQVIAARAKALTDNPALQTEETGLMQKAMELHTGTPSDADMAAFRVDVKAHMEKMRVAMLKADPTIQPLLDKLEAAAKQMQNSQ